MNPIQAVYEAGKLRLLDPIDLSEGQQVEVVVRIKGQQNLLRKALVDLNAQFPDPNAPDDEEIDEEALMREIHEATRGIPSISDAIIEERQY